MQREGKVVVVSPESFLAKLAVTDTAEIKAIEKRLDKSLESHFRVRSTPLFVSVDRMGSCDRVRNAVERMYEKEGWSVTFHSDQKDGGFYTFEPRGDPRD
jgi:hypothetical protein